MNDSEYIAILENALEPLVKKIEIQLQSYDLDGKPDGDILHFVTTWGKCRKARDAMKARGKIRNLVVRGDEIHYEG